MPATPLNDQDPDVATTSLVAKLLNTIVGPGEVFEEVLASPPSVSNWLAPTLLVCLSGIVAVFLSSPAGLPVPGLPSQGEPGLEATAPIESSLTHWRAVSLAATCFAAFVGTFWSAFVLWFIGRVFLKTSFLFPKAIEIAGLASLILVLDVTVTALLVEATGSPTARPAFSLILGSNGVGSNAFAVLAALNVFHLWAATLLALGLSKLSRVSFGEAAFWVFLYWIGIRIALALLR